MILLSVDACKRVLESFKVATSLTSLLGDTSNRAVKRVITFEKQLRNVPRGVSDSFYRAKHALQDLLGAIGGILRWTRDAPARFLVLVRDAIIATSQWLKSTILFAGKVILYLSAIGAILALSRCALRAYREHRARQEELAREQAWKLRTAQLREEEQERRRVADELKRQQQEAASAEQQRRRAAERSRTTEEAKRQEEQQMRRNAARRECERLEDLRRYMQWKTECDTVFSTGKGTLPEPPSWPCTQSQCQQGRCLRACSHSLERMFRSADDLRTTLLEERRRWHPNSGQYHKACPSNENMAHEITLVITALLEPLQAGREGS